MRKLTAALAFSLIALVACTESKTDAPATPSTPATPSAPATPATGTPPAATPAAPTATAPAGDPVAEAETIFTQRCTVCHGMSGKGDGPGAAALNPKPRDYSDVAWQKSVDDAYLAKVIVEGGAAVGKSPLMVANADLKDKPEVVKALVAKVRSFGGGAAAAPGTAPAPGGAAPAPTK